MRRERLTACLAVPGKVFFSFSFVEMKMSGDEGERGLADPENGVTFARFHQKMLINPDDGDGVTFRRAPVNFF